MIDESGTTAAAAPVTLTEPQKRALAVVAHQGEIDLLEAAFIEARLDPAHPEEVLDQYLYVILPDEQNKLPKPIVGPSIDFKWQMAAMMRRTQHGPQLEIDGDPIIEDVELKNGQTFVRVAVSVIDKRTGLRKPAVKEVPRKNRHAATIALEQAMGKALESHPAYNRKLVGQQIRAYLKRLGLKPEEFIIVGGSSGAYADLFSRAKRAGRTPTQVREQVRTTTGKGLSETQSAQDAAAAAKAVDDLVAQASTEGMPEDEALYVKGLREKCLEVITQAGIPKGDVARAWELLGSPERRRQDYERLYVCVQLVATGTPLAKAIAQAALKRKPAPGGTP